MFQTVSNSGKTSTAREEALLLMITFKGTVARDGISDCSATTFDQNPKKS
jgi:hypothetical protein